MESFDRLLSPTEVAKYLGVQRRWVILRIQSGELSGYKVGTFWRISEFELRRFLSRNRAGRRADDHAA
jgi:excisionase family DNA binding protein